MVVCRNHINNSLRKVRRDSARQLDEAALVAVAPVNQLAWIEAEIRALSPADQAVCRLCLVEGVSYREAALLLGTTETAVGKRLQRARIRLRRALSDESWEVLPHD
jgi:RNA polymerase sigma-70 factor (ECF subfamily)